MKHIITLFAIALLAFTLSCSHSGEKKGSITIELGKVNIASRSVVADFTNLIDEYDISLTSNSGFAEKTKTGVTGSTATFSDVEEGSWNITVSAKKAGAVVGTGSLSSQSVTGSSELSLTIPISFSQKGTGNFSLRITFPSSVGITGVSGVIAGKTLTPTLTTADGTVSATFEASAITSGYQDLVMTFTNGSTVLGVFREAVNIWDNVTSDKWVADDGSLASLRTFSANEFYSTDTSLSNLVVSAGSIAFASGTTEYALTIAGTSGTTTITPTQSVAGQTIQYQLNGGTLTNVSSGTASSALTLVNGINTISIKVTAPDRWSSKTYTVTIGTAVAMPVISPKSGNVQKGTATIACATDGATIRYTLDGNEPSESSAEYTSPITLATGTIKAKAFKSGLTASATASATYLVCDLSALAGKVTTIGGNLGGSGSVDAIGTLSRFKSPSSNVIVSGIMYVTDTSNHAIRKIVLSTGEVTTFAGTMGSYGSEDGTGTSARFFYPRGIATDGTNLYVGDYSRIRKIVIATAAVTTIAGAYMGSGTTDGTGSSARFGSYLYALVTNGTGLYVTDNYNNSIRKIDLTTSDYTVSTPVTYVYAPQGLAFDLTGEYIFIASNSGNKIYKAKLSDGALSEFSGLGGSNARVDGDVSIAQYAAPAAMVLVDGYLYVCETYDNAIRKVSATDGSAATLAGGSRGSLDAIGTEAQFYTPLGICSDGENLYVCDNANYTVRKIEISTAQVSTLAGGANAKGYADGIGTAAKFNNPAAMASDGISLYISDYYNGKIRKMNLATKEVTTLISTQVHINGIATDGKKVYSSFDHTIVEIDPSTRTYSTLAGNSANAYADGMGTSAKFYWPRGIACDGTNLYVADSSNNKIRKIVIAAKEVSTVASFDSPNGIATDGDYLYVSSTNNTVISKISFTGETLATYTASSGGYLTTDGTSLYIAAKSVNSIEKVNLSTGTVTSFVGGTAGSQDGTGSSAYFNAPEGITTDGKYLYVADTGNHIIRMIE